MSIHPLCPVCHTEPLEYECEREAGMCLDCLADEAGFQMPEPEIQELKTQAQLDRELGIIHRRKGFMNWIDNPTSSIREDGAKVGEFVIDGKVQWFGYPKNWRPRCELTALGPFETRGQAKYAIDTNLNLEIA